MAKKRKYPISKELLQSMKDAGTGSVRDWRKKGRPTNEEKYRNIANDLFVAMKKLAETDLSIIQKQIVGEAISSARKASIE